MDNVGSGNLNTADLIFTYEEPVIEKSTRISSLNSVSKIPPTN
jgi:hypothetical protein